MRSPSAFPAGCASIVALQESTSRGIIDYLRERALRQAVAPKRVKVDLFNTVFLEEISRRGRVSELSLMARFKMKTRDLTSDLATGMRLFLKGRLKLLTPGVRGLSEIKKSLGER